LKPEEEGEEELLASVETPEGRQPATRCLELFLGSQNNGTLKLFT
jgi:hypothetical protein